MLLQGGGVVLAEHGVLGEEYLAGLRVVDILGGVASVDPFGEGFNDLAMLLNLADQNAVMSSAVFLPDDDLLGYVHQTAGQIARVGGTQSGVGHALPGASGGDEILQHGQALTEVGLDGNLDGTAGGIGHQAAHAGQLADLSHGAAGSGVGHHENGIVLVHGLLEGVGHVLGGFFPGGHGEAVTLLVGNQAPAVLLVDADDLLLGVADELILLGGDGHIRDGHGEGAHGGVVVAQVLDGVQHTGGGGEAVFADALVDNFAQLLLAHHKVDLGIEHGLGIGAVHKAQVLGDGLVVNQAAHGGGDQLVAHLAVHLAVETDLDGGVEGDQAGVVGQHSLVLVGKGVVDIALVPGVGQVVSTQNHVLRGDGDRAAVLGPQQVVGRQHEHPGLSLGLSRQGNVDSHLVAVKVGVEGGTYQGVELDGPALHQDGLEGLDAQAV